MYNKPMKHAKTISTKTPQVNEIHSIVTKC